MSEYVAYDYAKQEWLDGEAARLELIRQVTQDLECLKGPSGDDFWSFAKKYTTFHNAGRSDTVSKAKYIEYLERQLEKLNNDQD